MIITYNWFRYKQSLDILAIEVGYALRTDLAQSALEQRLFQHQHCLKMYMYKGRLPAELAQPSRNAERTILPTFHPFPILYQHQSL